jgi:hypothetical protein
LLSRGDAPAIPARDRDLAVGDKVDKAAALAFLGSV